MRSTRQFSRGSVPINDGFTSGVPGLAGGAVWTCRRLVARELMRKPILLLIAVFENGVEDGNAFVAHVGAGGNRTETRSACRQHLDFSGVKDNGGNRPSRHASQGLLNKQGLNDSGHPSMAEVAD